MKEIGGTQTVDSQPFFYLYHQYGGSSLETLPEAESEEECSETEELSEIENPLTSTSCSNTASEGMLTPPNGPTVPAGRSHFEGSTDVKCQDQPIGDERLKILSLEAVIRQLRDELRESKDQNELLEFRLLEIEEFGHNTTQQNEKEGCNGGEATSETTVTSTLTSSTIGASAINSNVTRFNSTGSSSSSSAEVPAEVTVPSDDESNGNMGNSHASVAESRSSCSDCSESLSLQESGIFDSQSTEDSFATAAHPSCRIDISRGLVSLTSQIEGLVLRFSDSVNNAPIDNNGDTCSSTPKLTTCSSNNGKSITLGQGTADDDESSTSHDLTTELQSCGQRIQELERRLTQFSDVNYVHSLEDKVNQLVQDNQRLDEERAELEEAENDSRLQCQRVEEKMGHLRQRKTQLQNQLANEKRFIEQLRMKILGLQEREEDLCSQISRFESLVQNYEQRNFELEESCIEMKCSVQFVVHSIPALVLCYLWSLLRNLRRASGRLDALLCSKSARLTLLTPSLIWPGTGGLRRKHKLTETLAEASLNKKIRSDDHDADLEQHKMKVACPTFLLPHLSTSSTGTLAPVNVEDADCQTTDELWEQFMDQILASQRREWRRVEKFLRKKIELLESDMDKYRDMSNQEKQQMKESFQHKLCQKQKELDDSQALLSEHKHLQNKWNRLIQELEHFALYLGQNLCDADANDMQSRFHALASLISQPSQSSTLFPSAPGSAPNYEPTIMEIDNENEEEEEEGGEHEILKNADTKDLIGKVQQGLLEQRTTFKARECELMDEITRLKDEMAAVRLVSAEGRQKDLDNQSEVLFLAEENSRLHSLLVDQEKVWGKVKELEEENERLDSELGSSMSLRRRLDEIQATEKEMRIRLEELEQNEAHWKEVAVTLEKKERKCMERIHQLREEIQFLRSKCCQLQDDLDTKIGREEKYKSEVQMLTNKLKLTNMELEEKESHLETNEQSFHSQISKLKAQLHEVYQQFADAECSNGMLREEIVYLEKTLGEALEKVSSSDKMVQVLSSELRHREGAVDDLQKQLSHVSVTDETASHDLDVFAKNEGGLYGVARDVEQVVQLLKTCGRCEGASTKLTEVSEQLNTLTVMLRGSPDMLCISGNDGNKSATHLLLRCESEELLTPEKPAPQTSVEACSSCLVSGEEEHDKSAKTHISELENELLQRDTQIESLQDTMRELSGQISHLEDMFYVRQKELRESYLNESSWWKWRCEEKNLLVELLARRIAHLCATDVQGYFIEGILREIQELHQRFQQSGTYLPSSTTHLSNDFQCESLGSFLSFERRRVMNLLEDVGEGEESLVDGVEGEEEEIVVAMDTEQESLVDFRVLQRIGEDALLVSWTIPDKYSDGKVNGYEISVDGSVFLRIPQPNRNKVVLFGLNMSEPICLSLKCTGPFALPTSTITYFA